MITALLAFATVSVIVMVNLLRFKEEADRGAFDSCIRSIHTGLIDANTKSIVVLDANPEWSFLDAELIEVLEQKTVFGDCHQLPSGRLIDPWGERIRILYRSDSENGVEFRVWSSSTDKKLGTADDIISPYRSLDTVKHLADGN